MAMNAYKKRVKRSKHSITCNICSKVQSAQDHAGHVKNDHKLHSKTHCPWCYKSFKESGKSNNEPHLTKCFTMLEQGFKNFQKRINGATFQIPCRSCEDEAFTPKRYQLHMKSIHGNEGCHWCGDDSELSLEHQMDCFAKLESPPVEDVACEECIVFDSHLERRRMKGRIEGVHPSFYETPNSINSLNGPPGWFGTMSGHVRFDDESGLGDDAAGYIHKYMMNEFVWKHIVVRADAFGSFHDSMKRTEDVYLLPFSCLCDAGDEKEDAYRHHFHGIAVSRNAEAFTQMFNAVKFTERKYDHQNCRQPFPINTVHHLCNVMNYVGNPKATCRGLDDPKKYSDRHYYINRPFCPHANFYLHMCYRDGTQHYLENRHGNCAVWNKKVLDKKFFLISDLPGELRGCRPPLALDLVQGGHGPLFLWLPNGGQLLLKTLDEKRTYSKREFFRYGFAFADCILKRRYKLTKPQKRVANELHEAKSVAESEFQEEKHKLISDMQAQNMNEVLEKNYEIKHLKLKNEHLRTEMTLKEMHLQREITLKDDFHRQLDDLREQLDNLREQKDLTIQERDKEIKQLLMDKLTDIVNLHNENEHLLKEIIRQLEDKIELKDKICFILERLFTVGPQAKRQKTVE